MDAKEKEEKTMNWALTFFNSDTGKILGVVVGEGDDPLGVVKETRRRGVNPGGAVRFDSLEPTNIVTCQFCRALASLEPWRLYSNPQLIAATGVNFSSVVSRNGGDAA